jgi:hypothetical protein
VDSESDRELQPAEEEGAGHGGDGEGGEPSTLPNSERVPSGSASGFGSRELQPAEEEVAAVGGKGGEPHVDAAAAAGLGGDSVDFMADREPRIRTAEEEGAGGGGEPSTSARPHGGGAPPAGPRGGRGRGEPVMFATCSWHIMVGSQPLQKPRPARAPIETAPPGADS